MSAARIMRIITGGFEAFLGIPIIGGIYIMGQGYTPLLVMFILHIITYILSKNNNSATVGSILGIITSLIGWIPFVGFIMHIITAITLLITGFMPERRTE
ncbi:hypothetical protein CFK37_08080 [Virgibacillus phasianinus]|uniref:Uncharacterized protein n=1 Tax=Virgibacillus phasianinus TaxID=2017483 RepID=A0A220U1K6_9BACI|nr:hypothetical protein [Virgibacillus phasianinus]ASK62124.1 hypothetical protein CFK37_08080 [Virgibacillus phasianinus]